MPVDATSAPVKCELCGDPENISPQKLKLELSGASFSTMVRRVRICIDCIDHIFFQEDHDPE
jgi:hypothetical protein